MAMAGVSAGHSADGEEDRQRGRQDAADVKARALDHAMTWNGAPGRSGRGLMSLERRRDTCVPVAGIGLIEVAEIAA